jgi:hypothetical protein
MENPLSAGRWRGTSRLVLLSLLVVACQEPNGPPASEQPTDSVAAFLAKVGKRIC